MAGSILYFHSVLRYFLLLFAIIVIIQSLIGLLGKRDFKKINKIGALILMIICDTQLLFGFLIYFLNGWLDKLKDTANMKIAPIRYFTIEHSVSMIIAIILIHLGYSIVKKKATSDRKFKQLFWTTLLALFIMLAMIPWPGKKDVGRPLVPHLALLN